MVYCRETDWAADTEETTRMCHSFVRSCCVTPGGVSNVTVTFLPLAYSDLHQTFVLSNWFMCLTTA